LVTGSKLARNASRSFACFCCVISSLVKKHCLS